MLITNKQITELIGSTAYARAALIFASNNIEHFEIIDSTNQIFGLVKGTASRPYKITIDLAADLNNECSCPVSFDCKHVGALLLKYISTQTQTQTQTQNKYRCATKTCANKLK